MTPSEINLERIFLDYVVTNQVVLFNPCQTLRAVYELQSEENNDQISIDFEKPKGIIEPQQSLSVPIQIKGSGQLTNAVQLVVGHSSLVASCRFSTGRGPVDYLRLNWLVVPVLQTSRNPSTQKSVGSSTVHSLLRKENSVWKMGKRRWNDSNQMAELNVLVEVDDSIHFEDKLVVSVDNGKGSW